MRFTQVELAGFRGHVLTLDLPAAGIISGLNGTGKTSIAQAILLATTQQVPGAMTDNEGVVATGPCLDWTGTTGRWGVTVHDSGGAQASFEFAADGDSGRRNVKLSGCDARKNSIVRQALVDRYGAPHVGPMLLDLEAMRAMAPDQLEKMILRLCGGVSEWTPKRLLNEVALGALSRAKQTSVDELALDLPALRARFSELGLAGGSEGDVRDVLLVLGITSKERQKAARSAVLATNPVLEAPTPDAPDTTTIAGLRQEAEAAQQAAYRASETVAAVRAELDRGREDIRRWERTRAERVRAAEGAVAEAQRRLDDVRRAYAAATEEERRGKERLEARRAEVGNLEAEMQRLAQQSGGEAAAAAARELAAARQELAQANAEIVAIEAGPEPMVSPEKLRELEAARAVHAESGAEYRGLTGELAAAKADQRVQQQQAAALESGICPTCGQTTHGVLEDMEEDFAAAARLVARIEQDLERTRKVGVAARETIALCEAAQQGAEKARSIRSAQIDRARANAHAAGDRVRQAERKTERLTRGGGEQQAALDSRAEGLRALIAELAEQLDAVATRRCEALEQLEAADAQLAAAKRALVATSADDTGRPPEPAEVARRLLAAEEQSEHAKRAAKEASEAYHSAQAQRALADEDAQRKADAQCKRLRAQAWGDIWRSVAAAAHGLEREVLEGLVAPITRPMDKLAKKYGVNIGTFTARFGARFGLGYETVRGFAPLSSLSAGHFAMAMIMLSATLHRLAQSPCRVVVLDGGEALDAENRATFWRLARWLVDGGHLDQVLVFAVDPTGWGPGAVVVDIEQRRLAV